ncbi:MAG TPA: DUF4383 domain-containing protein [bacterium]|nr:DUF4383 domain-containing protein [bacterium]
MIKTFTLILGIVLLAVGVVGWITGGHDHVLVVFGINMAHNIVHILTGLIAILAVLGGESYARIYCIVFGLVYGVVTVMGFINHEAIVGLLNLNMPDNLLHLAISVACLAVGLAGRSSRA